MLTKIQANRRKTVGFEWMTGYTGELVMHFSLVDDDLTVGAGLSQEQLLS